MPGDVSHYHASIVRIVSYIATVILSSSRRIEEKARRIIHMQRSGVIVEVRKASKRVVQRGSCERDTIVPAVRKTPNALAPIAALACAGRITAIRQDHLVPEERRW